MKFIFLVILFHKLPWANFLIWRFSNVFLEWLWTHMPLILWTSHCVTLNHKNIVALCNLHNSIYPGLHIKTRSYNVIRFIGKQLIVNWKSANWWYEYWNVLVSLMIHKLWIMLWSSKHIWFWKQWFGIPWAEVSNTNVTSYLNYSSCDFSF